MRIILVLASLVLASSAFASNEVSNPDQLRHKFGLDAYTANGASSSAVLNSLKIAILDNGFAGYEAGKGMLPDSTVVVDGSHNAESPTPHGLGMAQIVWAMTGQNSQGPQFYLVNTNGFSNFKDAVDFVIAKQVDIVLYSQVWPFGSNFDGKGFINAQVNKATSAGILWINAAGNFKNMVYNGSVLDSNQSNPSQTANAGYLKFPSGNSLHFENMLDDNAVTLTLSWTDFQDTETYNSNKDLDLFVYDDKGNLVGSSELIQHGEAPPADGSTSQLSSYSRETITLPKLDRGKYQIKILNKSANFIASDKYRVLIEVDRPGSLVFTDHSNGYEIMPPADNASVITVGENSDISSIGPTIDGRAKPDTLIDNATVQFTNGDETRGSSDAAAILTGIVAEMKSACPSLNFDTLSAYASQTRVAANASDLHPVDPSQVPTIVSAFIPAGGSVMAAANGHLVVLTPQDPLSLPLFQDGNAYRVNPTDVLAFSFADSRWIGMPAAQEPMIQAPIVEFRQAQSGFWTTPAPGCL